ncbi:MAG: ABC transporter ATP-binding protein [Pseudomonadota bacterium]
MTDIAISARGLGRAFGELWAVRGLDLEVRRGEIFGLVGPDGAGKTTAIRLLTGILAPSEGTASVAGLPIGTDDELIKTRIGYMSQRFGLYGDLSVEENLRFYADLYEVGRAQRAAAEERLLGFSNLTPFRKRLARDLSGGMKQKLGLACALIHKPEVLFLDEPTNGVDPVSRRDFWRILYNMLKEGVTIFVSTAYLDEAERCTRVGLMHRGRLIRCDTPRRLKDGIPGTLIEVQATNAREVQQQLARLLGRHRVSLFGAKLHIHAADEDEARRMDAALTELGIAVDARENIAATLEDVFVIEMARESPETHHG